MGAWLVWLPRDRVGESRGQNRGTQRKACPLSAGDWALRQLPVPVGFSACEGSGPEAVRPVERMKQGLWPAVLGLWGRWTCCDDSQRDEDPEGPLTS